MSIKRGEYLCLIRESFNYRLANTVGAFNMAYQLAYLGMTGQNPRKGTCATLDDLTAELCDVIIAAMVALTTVTSTAAGAETRLQQHLTVRFTQLITRISPGPVEEWGCESCGDAWFGIPPDDGLCAACRDYDSVRPYQA